jgi:hypothetical protein
MLNVQTFFNLPDGELWPNNTAVLPFNEKWESAYKEGRVLAEHPERGVAAFTAYRFAADLYPLLGGINCATYWMAYGALAFYVITQDKKLKRRWPRLTDYIALLYSPTFVLSAFFAYPLTFPNVVRFDAQCNDFREDGSVHGTTDRVKSWIVVPGCMILVCWVSSTLHLFLNACTGEYEEKKKRSGSASGFLQLLAVFASAAAQAFEVLTFDRSLNAWLDEIKLTSMDWDVAATKQMIVIEDFEVLVSTTIGVSLSAAVLSQRYLFNDASKMAMRVYALFVVSSSLVPSLLGRVVARRVQRPQLCDVDVVCDIIESGWDLAVFSSNGVLCAIAGWVSWIFFRERRTRMREEQERTLEGGGNLTDGPSQSPSLGQLPLVGNSN